MPKLTKVKEIRGITIIALVVTIVILLILAGISIATLTGDNGLIKNASEAEIKAALAEVREQLDLYKIQGERERIKDGDYSGEMSNEELIGAIYAQGFMGDTYRTVGIIKANSLKEELNCGTKLGKSEQKEDIQNQIDSGEITNLDNIYQLYDIFVVDFTDDTLYYVKNNEIWSIEGTKTEYTLADGNIVQSYPIEQIDQEYSEQRKFITEWTVEAGTQITLPINVAPNITIEWGADDNGDGNLDTEKCTTIKPTHTYTKSGTYTIKISGNMPNWTFNGVNDSKNYITKIIQWGNTNVEKIDFYNCSNLAGNIPSPNVDGLFDNCTSMRNLFHSCSGLIGEIPSDLFKSCVNTTDFASVFWGCSSLTGEIPNDLFKNCINATEFSSALRECTSLTGEIPSNLFANCTKAKVFNGTFAYSTGITGKIPAKLFENCTTATIFYGVFENTGITEIEEGFTISSMATNLGRMFANTKIVTIPKSFTIPNGVTNMNEMFWKCKNLIFIPDIFTIPDTVTDVSSMFYQCTALETLPNNFVIPQNVTATARNTYGMFSNCYKLKGSIIIKASPINYIGMFRETSSTSGENLVVNYTSSCTNIDDLIATNDTGTVIKGELIED